MTGAFEITPSEARKIRVYLGLSLANCFPIVVTHENVAPILCTHTDPIDREVFDYYILVGREWIDLQHWSD